MPNFHRYYIPNALVFITCVTNQRKHYLEGPQNLQLFWKTLRTAQRFYPFHLFAYAIMPDHFHWIMQLPEDQPNFSNVLHCVKRNFTLNFKKAYAIQDHITLWQARFWDHIIHDALDLEQHVEYIHWNPVKHQLVQTPEEWEQSSLRFWIDKGYYPGNWGVDAVPKIATRIIEDV